MSFFSHSLRHAWLALPLALLLALSACSASGSASGGTSTSSGTTTGSGGSTTTGSTTTGSSTTTTASGSTTTTASGFQVTSVSATLDASSFNCANSVQTFTFTATINVAPNTGGTVTYNWVRSDGATHAPYIVTVPSGSTSVTVSTTWTVGSGIPNGTYWEQVQTTAPNSVSSNQPVFAMHCHLQVIGATASASPTSYNCANSSQFISFNGTITFAPGNNGGTLTYTWGRSDGATQTTPYSLTIPPGTTSYTLPVYPATDGEYWDIGKAAGNGTYWEKIQISAPNSFTSNQASFTISC
jgi:hypothetical protein